MVNIEFSQSPDSGRYPQTMRGWTESSGSAHIKDVRERNLALVLEAVQHRTAASLGELAEDTGLVPSAINKMVAQLFDIGLLVDHSTRSSGGRGRPERVLAIGDTAALAVGVDVNAEGIGVRVEQVSGELLDSVALDVPGQISLAEIGKRSAHALDEVLRKHALQSTPIAMTVALPSLIANGIVNSPARGWDRVALSAFSDAFRLDVRSFDAVNDGVAAITAEYWASERPRYTSLALLHGTDGIAGGLIDHGARVGGWEGAAGLYGHLVVEPGGRLCLCGQYGCLWLYASVSAIAEELGVRKRGTKDRPLLAIADELAGRARDGDEEVLGALRIARGYIQRAIQILSPVVSPERVVISGNLVPLFEWIIPGTQAVNITDGARINWERPVIRSEFGASSVAIGASWLSRRAILSSPLHWASSGVIEAAVS